MTSVKITLAALVLALIACNGLGFMGIPRMLGNGECHLDVECISILPYCKEKTICNNGICICDQTKASLKSGCKTNADCAIFICDPPYVKPYCDIKHGVCKCSR
ncbi:hypothetical protein GYH30_016378 [Glycine max]|nr:hypothetical protein GYH30_016378 [Glycine max]